MAKKRSEVVLTKKKSKKAGKWSAVQSINQGVKGFGIGLGKKTKKRKPKRVTL